MVRGVPEKVPAILVNREDKSGQSLQECLLDLLENVTSRPTAAESLGGSERLTIVVARLPGSSGVPFPWLVLALCHEAALSPRRPAVFAGCQRVRGV